MTRPSPANSLPRRVPTGPVRKVVDTLTSSGVSISQIARAWAIDRRTLQRVLLRPTLRSDTADRIAIAAGRHPTELWPDWATGGGGSDQG
jgi:lambda repressor-like predicted transcriptional regulator